MEVTYSVSTTVIIGWAPAITDPHIIATATIMVSGMEVKTAASEETMATAGVCVTDMGIRDTADIAIGQHDGVWADGDLARCCIAADT
jgi:hypothetical protein